MAIHEMEYKGLNLLDEVCTVEVAIDEVNHRIHIFDTKHVVEPTYDFVTKSYVLSEGFELFVKVLRQKYYFAEYKELHTSAWIEQLQWIFYSSNQKIKVYDNTCFQVYDAAKSLENESFFSKYTRRLISL